MCAEKKRGFTLLEILIVLAIFVIMASIAVASLKSYNTSASLKSAAGDVRTALMNARNDTLASDGDTVFGVHIDEDKIVHFAGDTYTAGDPSNKEYTFTGTVEATSTLTGGATEVVFTRLSGEPNVTGTIEVYVAGTATKTITISQTGLIE